MILDDHIHHGDTVGFMRGLPDESARLVIADPPYNIGKDFGTGHIHDDVGDWLEWSKQWLFEATRLLAPDGNLFVYSIHHYACYLQCHLYSAGLTYRRQIIWYYENGWSKYRHAPACHYEPILWFAKRHDSVYHPIREPYKSNERLKYRITKKGKVWSPHPDGRLAGDVWRIPTLAGRRFAKERVDHPTQKPLALSLRLVEHYSNPGDVVLVPFVGSGSECVAAKQLGRTYIGAELNADYIALARARLAELQIQMASHPGI